MPAEQTNVHCFTELQLVEGARNRLVYKRWFHNHKELLFNAMPVYSTGQTCAPQKEVE